MCNKWIKFFVVLIVAVIPNSGSAQESYFKQKAGVDVGGPILQNIDAYYHEQTNRLKFAATFSPSSGRAAGSAKGTKIQGFKFALSDGPLPLQRNGVAVFYLDATDAVNPKLLVYASNGAHNQENFQNFDRGYSRIVSSLLRKDWIKEIIVRDNADGTRTLGVDIDATVINKYSPPSEQNQWFGTGFSVFIGYNLIYSDGPVGASYDAGFLTGWGTRTISTSREYAGTTGCDGVVGSRKAVDACGVCGGNGASCAGCDGIANSNKKVDSCEVCGGSGTSCIGCDGVINSAKTVDACGVCGGNATVCTTSCSSRSIAGQVRLLDRQATILRHAVLRGNRYLGLFDKKAVRSGTYTNAVKVAKKLSDTAWIEIGSVPTSLLTCAASPKCSDRDYSGAFNSYLKSVKDLTALALDIGNKLERIKRKRAKTEARLIKKVSRASYTLVTRSVSSVPKSSAVCTGS